MYQQVPPAPIIRLASRCSAMVVSPFDVSSSRALAGSEGTAPVAIIDLTRPERRRDPSAVTPIRRDRCRRQARRADNHCFGSLY